MEIITDPRLQATDRLRQNVAALAALLDQTMKDIQVLDSEFQEQIQTGEEMERLKQSVAGYEIERARLSADCQQANELLEQSRQEHNRGLAETAEAAAVALERQIARAAARSESERAQLIEENQRLTIQLNEAGAAAAATEIAKSSGDRETLSAEVARVEDSIQVITQVIEDPNAELSVVIRKNVERSALESYLKGLRFASQGS